MARSEMCDVCLIGDANDELKEVQALMKSEQLGGYAQVVTRCKYPSKLNHSKVKLRVETTCPNAKQKDMAFVTQR